MCENCLWDADEIPFTYLCKVGKTVGRMFWKAVHITIIYTVIILLMIYATQDSNTVVS
jgi:hypothetical protein